MRPRILTPVNSSVGLSSRNIVGRFYERLEGAFDGSWVSKIIMKESFSGQYGEYKVLDRPPPMHKFRGQRERYRPTSKGVIVANEPWESGVNIPLDDINRQNDGQIDRLINGLADRAVENIEKQVSLRILNGHTGTYGTCIDGQFLFDTDHSEGQSGTQKNLLTAADVPALDVSNTADVTPAEMGRIIVNCIMKFYAFLDMHGDPLNGGAKNFLVMTGVPLSSAVTEALAGNPLVGVSGAVSGNPVRNAPFKVEGVCNPRITSSTKLFIFRTDSENKPFIVQEEKGVELLVLAEGSDFEIENRAHAYTAEWVGGFGIGVWDKAISAEVS